MIFQKEAVVTLFQNPEFLGEWDNLWQNCPWATVFQHRDFVTTWFQFYPIHQPLLVTDWDGKKLSGILILTFQDKDVITGAGLDQAEYQTWLSYPNFGDEFIHTSILALLKEFPRKTLHLKYLHSQTPLTWIKNSWPLNKHFYLKEHEQPLILLDKEHLEAELKKKNRKEKINRLKRMGNLSFVEISSVSGFKNVIDEMILQNDFRKGAIYGKMVFQKEVQRKDFLLKMFELGHLHVSLLKLNETVIASNAGFTGTDVVHLQGINSHSPFFSKFSPGILLFLMLGIQLSEKGKKYFDLTPGGIDGYKSMLSNSTETVHELWISNKKFIFVLAVRETVKKWILNLSERSGFFSAAFSTYSNKIKGRRTFIKWKGRYGSNSNNSDDTKSTKDKLYFNLISTSFGTKKRSEFFAINKNQISDLFLFDERKKELSKRELFSDSLKKIEMGHDLITVVQGEKLKAVLWFIKGQEKNHLENSGRRSTFDAPILAISFCDEACFSDVIYTMKENIGFLFPDNEKIKGIMLELNKDDTFKNRFYSNI